MVSGIQLYDDVTVYLMSVMEGICGANWISVVPYNYMRISRVSSCRLMAHLYGFPVFGLLKVPVALVYLS